ncbi:MAG: class I SAM-dependent methyltransferase [bacterium]
MFMLRLAKKLPKPIKSLCKKIGLDHIAHKVYDKSDVELAYQKEWGIEFAQNQDKVREYWERYRFFDEILGTCELNEESRVLDVGCGISTVLHFVPGKRIGVDPLGDQYQDIYSYPNDMRIVKASAEQIPFSENQFDVVFCTNVIDHVTSPGSALDEVERVLMPGGYFILTVETFASQKERDPAHPHCMTKEDVLSLVKDRFDVRFLGESPWIGLRQYVQGVAGTDNKEMILILQKSV